MLVFMRLFIYFYFVIFGPPHSTRHLMAFLLQSQQSGQLHPAGGSTEPSATLPSSSQKKIGPRVLMFVVFYPVISLGRLVRLPIRVENKQKCFQTKVSFVN